jgi:hypothetical protein
MPAPEIDLETLNIESLISKWCPKLSLCAVRYSVCPPAPEIWANASHTVAHPLLIFAEREPVALRRVRLCAFESSSQAGLFRCS